MIIDVYTNIAVLVSLEAHLPRRQMYWHRKIRAYERYGETIIRAYLQRYSL